MANRLGKYQHCDRHGNRGLADAALLSVGCSSGPMDREIDRTVSPAHVVLLGDP